LPQEQAIRLTSGFPVAGDHSPIHGVGAGRQAVEGRRTGWDELLGGYARYLVAYLEQSLKAAMEGTYKHGNYVVTIESIVPNLGLLREYKPMIKEYWREGSTISTALFPPDRSINRHGRSGRTP
jgi:asparagine synthase (glutamine-hydrolysing)